MSTPHPPDDPLEGQVSELGKASRRIALLSVAGFLLVVTSISLAIGKASALKSQNALLTTQQASLANENLSLVAKNGQYHASLAAGQHQRETLYMGLQQQTAIMARMQASTAELKSVLAAGRDRSEELTTQLNSLEAAQESWAKEKSALNARIAELGAALDQSERGRMEVNSKLTKSDASLAVARVAFHASRIEDTVTIYDEALAAHSDNSYLQNLRAYSLFRLGRTSAAIEGQQRSLATDPNYAWGYFDLARFLYAASPPRLKEAQDAEAKAIELSSAMRSIMQTDEEFQRLRGLAMP